MLCYGMAIAMYHAEVQTMTKTCVPSPYAAAIRAMSSAQLGELINTLTDRMEPVRDPASGELLDVQDHLDAVTGPLFDSAMRELIRRFPPS